MTIQPDQAKRPVFVPYRPIDSDHRAARTGLLRGALIVSTLALCVGAAALGLVLAILSAGWVALPMACAVAAVTLAVGAVAQAKIGGQTGDVLGASQQLAVAAALAVAS